MKPYYDHAGITIYHGDCREVMASMAEGDVHAVVTDPPYGQTNESYDSSVAADPAVWRACFRLAADGSALLSFAGSPKYHRVATAVESAGWRVKQMWAWVYRDGYITSAYPKEGFDRLAPAMDPIVFAAKGKALLSLGREGDRSWDRLTGRREPYKPSGMSDRAGGLRKRRGVGRYPRAIVSDGAPPFEYFALPRAVGYRQSDHPNEKPLALLLWLVGKLPGGLILDPFMGSGTTLRAAKDLGRRAVGVEIEERYCEVAARRMSQDVIPWEAEA